MSGWSPSWRAETPVTAFTNRQTDGGQIVADRQFPAGKGGAGRDAELTAASFALPDAARRVGLRLEAAAARTKEFAAIMCPTDSLKACMDLAFAQHGEGL